MPFQLKRTTLRIHPDDGVPGQCSCACCSVRNAVRTEGDPPQVAQDSAKAIVRKLEPTRCAKSMRGAIPLARTKSPGVPPAALLEKKAKSTSCDLRRNSHYRGRTPQIRTARSRQTTHHDQAAAA